MACVGICTETCSAWSCSEWNEEGVLPVSASGESLWPGFAES